MIGEIWDYIIDGISYLWEGLTQLPELFSGLFGEVNFFGWLILTIVAEASLWFFWYYTRYKVEAKSFFSPSLMVICTIVAAPAIAYFIARHYAAKD